MVPVVDCFRSVGFAEVEVLVVTDLDLCLRPGAVLFNLG